MNRLLVSDLNIFIRDFPDAHKFLTAAHLRYKAYCLYLQPYLAGREKKLLAEILEAPACKEVWFIDMIGGKTNANS